MAGSAIHPTAVIAEGARLGEDVAIGPFCVVGPQVQLASGVRLHSHVVIDGRTEIGSQTQIFPFASIGTIPQDKKFQGEESRLVIGARNVIREHVTMNPGTQGGGGVTQIGNDGLFLAGSHVAHDCRIGDHVILVNNATLAGHCDVGDFVIMGGLSAVHQHVRIGEHAFIGGMSGVENDVIPFGSVIGNRAHLGGLNLVGLKRRNFPRDQIHALRAAYRMLFTDEGTLKDRVEQVAQAYPDQPLVRQVVEFIRAGSDRAFCTPRPGR
jgi:UDP-N-acetylglucosamine acyltransferase